MKITLLGQERTVPGTCECELERYEAEKRERERREDGALVERRFEGSWLPPRLADATLEGFVRRPGTAAMVRATQRYIARWPEQLTTGEGMVLRGPVGTGKGHLAAVIVRHVIQAGGTAIFAKIPQLMVRCEATHGDGARETEADILDALIRADLVVLDDIGAQKWTERREERLYTIVDARYDSRRPIIATTNAENHIVLQENVGFRTMDRLFGCCVMVETKAASYRREEHERLALGARKE